MEGNSRDLPPLVRDEIYLIACESLRNAFKHAQARRIEVELRYDPRRFQLRVLDNGQETIAHEGSHLADYQSFVNSIDFSGNMDQSLNITHMATEIRARTHRGRFGASSFG